MTTAISTNGTTQNRQASAPWPVGTKVRYVYLEHGWLVHGYGWITDRRVEPSGVPLLYEIDHNLALKQEELRPANLAEDRL
jgi:hypothetical protein